MIYENSRYTRNIYINSIYAGKNSKILEGGMARDYAFMNWIENKIQNCKIVQLDNNKLKNICTIFYILIFKKYFNIVFQYPRIGIPIYNNTFLGKIISNLYINLIMFASKKNNLIFDVSDIKYEQLVDLNINMSNLDYIKKLEYKFFKLPVEFIFASDSMRHYACKKYEIEIEDTDVCINGGNKITYDKKSNLEKYIDKDKINYVYAGSLNKGRQIEQMIYNFLKNSNVQLILMGTGGEWIQDNDLPQNIIYLGAVEEIHAHYIVSKCDIGLIPYDDSKLYYNIAYPTKLSFYITAGIPFLSTGVNEVKIINEKYNIGFIDKITNWSEAINNITLEEIKEMKIRISNINEEFYWENIFNKNKFIK